MRDDVLLSLFLSLFRSSTCLAEIAQSLPFAGVARRKQLQRRLAARAVRAAGEIDQAHRDHRMLRSVGTSSRSRDSSAQPENHGGDGGCVIKRTIVSVPFPQRVFHGATGTITYVLTYVHVRERARFFFHRKRSAPVAQPPRARTSPFRRGFSPRRTIRYIRRSLSLFFSLFAFLSACVSLSLVGRAKERGRKRRARERERERRGSVNERQ